MLLTEYDEIKTMRQFKEEGREEGIAEGMEQGIEAGIIQEKLSGIERAMKKQNMTLAAAMDYMDIPPQQQPKYAAMLREGTSGNESYVTGQ